MPDDNYRNLSREAKHQRELLTVYFNHLGALAGQEDMGATLGIEEAGIYLSFSGLPNYSKKFYLSWIASNKFPKNNPIHFQQVSKLFPTKS